MLSRRQLLVKAGNIAGAAALFTLPTNTFRVPPEYFDYDNAKPELDKIITAIIKKNQDAMVKYPKHIWDLKEIEWKTVALSQGKYILYTSFGDEISMYHIPHGEGNVLDFSMYRLSMVRIIYYINKKVSEHYNVDRYKSTFDNRTYTVDRTARFEDLQP